MINRILQIDRKLGLEIRILKKILPPESIEIFDIVNNYLTDYCEYYNLTPGDVIAAIHKFSKRYSEDIKNFKKTNKFPYQLNHHAFELSRIEYDLFLMSSFLFTNHRFSILNEIYKLTFTVKNCLVVGVGSGLELEFLNDKANHLFAFDISISKFIKIKHQNVNFKEKMFTTIKTEFDIVFAIELIEHLRDPFKLIKDMYKSLVKNGKLVITTVKNVPQFDHLYNFTSDFEFEKRVKEIGFRIVQKVIIPHNYLIAKIEANNVFYTLIKN